MARTFQIRDVDYDLGLRLAEGDSAFDVLEAFLSERLDVARNGVRYHPGSSGPPWEVVRNNGTCIATYSDGRTFAAVPV